MIEEDQMKKIDVADLTSNVLIFSSVMVALTPFLLGDQLPAIVNNALSDGSMMLTQLSGYVSYLLS